MIQHCPAGATGQLGRLVVEALLDHNVPPAQIVAGGWDLAKFSDLADRGVHIRTIDYSDPASLRAAFAGAHKVLLISGSEVGQRLPQHRDAVAATKEAGVGLIAYISVANAGTTGMALAAEHQATEELLQESGVPFCSCATAGIWRTTPNSSIHSCSKGQFLAAPVTVRSAPPRGRTTPRLPPLSCSITATSTNLAWTRCFLHQSAGGRLRAGAHRGRTPPALRGDSGRQ